MFYQVGVNQEDRNLLYFLWWDNCDLEKEPKEYWITVQLFRVTSSPGYANCTPKSTVDTYESLCGKAATDFVRKNFYVDAGLKSVVTAAEATLLVHSDLCTKGGYNLHKFTTLSNIPTELRPNDVQNLDLDCYSLLIERTLGIEWCVKLDIIEFFIQVKDRSFTQHEILSKISSMFDPLGLVSSFVLIGKQILEELVRDGAMSCPGWQRFTFPCVTRERILVLWQG